MTWRTLSKWSRSRRRVHQTKEGQGDNYWDSSFCFSWRLQGVLCQGNCWSRSNSNRDWHHHQAWWRCWLDQGKNISPIDKKVVFEKWSNIVHQKYFCELLLFSLTIKMFKGDKLKLQLVWQSLNKHIISFWTNKCLQPGHCHWFKHLNVSDQTGSAWEELDMRHWLMSWFSSNKSIIF